MTGPCSARWPSRADGVPTEYESRVPHYPTLPDHLATKERVLSALPNEHRDARTLRELLESLGEAAAP